MDNAFEINGLVIWREEEIRLREHFRDTFARSVESALLNTNPGWKMFMIEAPILTPKHILNANYTADDIWVQETRIDGETGDAHRILALRPETTPGSYAWAVEQLSNHSGIKPPFVVWQAGKSFRREIVQPTKHMRLKEFYQQEFQCIYTADSMNDYHSAIIEPVRKMISDAVMLPTRIVASDRLPTYSRVTMDIEVNNGDKHMEVCSISLRTDFPSKARFQTKNGLVEKDLLVVEIAIGLDRIIYNWQIARLNT